MSRRTGDRESIAHSLLSRGHVAFDLGDLERAEACWDECLRLARELDHATFQPHALYTLTRVVSLRGDLERATALGEEALAMFQLRGDRWGAVGSREALMGAARRRADPERVTMLARENLAHCLELGSPSFASSALSGLAWVARIQDEAARAGRLLGAVEALTESIGRQRQKSEQDAHEADVTAVRAALGDEAFAMAWAEGRAMSLEQAVAYALDAPAAE